MKVEDSELNAWLREASRPGVRADRPEPLPMAEWLEALNSMLRLFPEAPPRELPRGEHWKL